MTGQIQAYKTLVDSFLKGEMSAESFQDKYLKMVQADEALYEGDIGLVIDELFADVDAFTRDPELLSEEPDFYLDEQRLREKARIAAHRFAGVTS